MKFKLLTAVLFATIGNHALYSQNSWNLKYTFTDHSQNWVAAFIDENKGFVSGFTNDGKGAIKYTADGGTTWTEIFKQNNLGYVPGFSFLDENNIWAFHDQNIYKTTNGGISWTISTVSNSMGYLRSVKYSSLTEGIMKTSKGKYKTTDGGQNWTVVKIYSSNDFELNSNGQSINPSTGEGYGIIGMYLYQTNDYGETWTQILTMPNYSTAQSRRYTSVHYKGYLTGEYFYGTLGYDGTTFLKSSNNIWQKLPNNFIRYAVTDAFPDGMFMGYADQKIYNIKTKDVIYTLPGNEYISYMGSIGNVGHAVGGNKFYKYSNASALATQETTVNSFKVYTQNNSVVVQSPSTRGNISIYDMSGALIKSGVPVKKGETKTIELNQGVYIVTIHGEQRDYSQKIQIK
ncbi:WD40/YVTN/BNR-like repeat-containing protein [Chryseobacterium vrystaatense]|nr:T9SS type A sorting domain-containing protein [Chryseobacterium vrystaatense]